jgi:hypothetical protein
LIFSRSIDESSSSDDEDDSNTVNIGSNISSEKHDLMKIQQVKIQKVKLYNFKESRLFYFSVTQDEKQVF